MSLQCVVYSKVAENENTQGRYKYFKIALEYST